MTDSVYPLARPSDGNDPRFTTGLLLDVIAVLVQHGYPECQPADFVHFQQALFSAVYAPRERRGPFYVPKADGGPVRYGDGWMAKLEADEETADRVEQMRRNQAALRHERAVSEGGRVWPWK